MAKMTIFKDQGRVFMMLDHNGVGFTVANYSEKSGHGKALLALKDGLDKAASPVPQPQGYNVDPFAPSRSLNELIAAAKAYNLAPAIREMQRGNKINAIKEVRAICGFRLKEAKDYVESDTFAHLSRI